ncbi:thioredoxin reductase [Buchnera aphidicola str. Bp (Baizongia pistaciae)]|uniref:Thioredoxin reductase n=1 Tax=Buchnera aphidicola subsp. Baizongia pistaciae (strain Bp) TaxID=224915 RepID=TRXB_BUCBP|nr:thioredoxin-disulfide reductase [Buchnera aphidicola]Q89AJ2.1 RecName: Full=Thioredoxin reductase; Short=TRXR [Buchnera aphidicola str. Bp (Baizongia pistaciae)]AAO27016.1 thioredoxin reductase [Buchnera aphidicola str. Bp (Baizongia pistaciae)]
MIENTLKIEHHKLIILGSGPAGYTAAIYSARANLEPLLFTGNNKGGQLINTNEIENWPGDSKSLTGLELMERMHNHAKSLNTKIIPNEIIRVNFFKIPFLLVSDTNQYYTSDSVIIATGASPKYLGLTSESKFIGKGVSVCAVCDGFFYKNEDVAVVGGGNTALEEALYLSNIARKVYLIHRRKTFSAEKILISRMLNKTKKNIILRTGCIVNKIIGGVNGVRGVQITCNDSKENKCLINLSGVFIAIGHAPNTKLFKNQLFMKNDYILVKSGIHGNVTQTNIPGIFAAGDVIDHVYKQAITSSASGCMAALDAEKYIDQKYGFKI